MAKFNAAMSIGQQLRARADATANFEGGLAFELDPRTRLYTRVASALMGEKKFYESAQQADAALIADVQAVAEMDPEFVLRLAAYARQALNLRSVSVALLAEAAAIPGCKPFVRSWTPEIIRRADEPAEAIAYW
ncbi:MAG: TROVE domain-containing protein, partial [bacterium]|nr:TROVE domain-containing protein [bacterium]